MSRTSLHSTEWSQENFSPIIVDQKIAVPFTDIVNREQIRDESNTLKAAMGVERIIFNS